MAHSKPARHEFELHTFEMYTSEQLIDAGKLSDNAVVKPDWRGSFILIGQGKWI